MRIAFKAIQCVLAKWRGVSLSLRISICVHALYDWMQTSEISIFLMRVCVCLWRWQVCSLSLLTSSANSNYWCEKKRRKKLVIDLLLNSIWYVPIIMIIISLIQICNLLLLLSLSLFFSPLFHSLHVPLSIIVISSVVWIWSAFLYHFINYELYIFFSFDQMCKLFFSLSIFFFFYDSLKCS